MPFYSSSMECIFRIGNTFSVCGNILKHPARMLQLKCKWIKKLQRMFYGLLSIFVGHQYYLSFLHQKFEFDPLQVRLLRSH